jgi:hypothetical protein
MYEIHITCYQNQEAIAELVANELHWKTSKIAGDPVLGKDTYFYLTTHTATEKLAYERLGDCEIELNANNVVVVRSKIEHIIYDKRYKPK